MSFSQVWIISFPCIAHDCSLRRCLTSSRVETCENNEALQHFLLTLLKREDPIKLVFHISWLHIISFSYNRNASFFRHRIVEWPWIEFKMGPCCSKVFEKISILMLLGVQSNLLVLFIYYFLIMYLIPHPYMLILIFQTKVFWTILKSYLNFIDFTFLISLTITRTRIPHIINFTRNPII